VKVLTILFFIILNFNVYGNTTTNWKLVKNVDKMTNELESCVIMSKFAKADKELSFPYNKLQSNIVISGKLKPLFGFTSEANLNKDSYTLKDSIGVVKTPNRVINTRIKFDKEVKKIQLIQILNMKQAIFFYNENDEKQLFKSSKILLELDWYNEGKIYFEYNLKGVSKAIKNMKEKCRK